MTHNLNKDPLEETQGDTFSDTVSFNNSDGTDVDITGWTLYATVKQRFSDPDEDAVLSQDVTAHDDAANGVTSFSFPPSDTEDLSGAYHFELKYEDTSGEVNTILRRPLEFNNSVRKSI